MRTTHVENICRVFYLTKTHILPWCHFKALKHSTKRKCNFEFSTTFLLKRSCKVLENVFLELWYLRVLNVNHFKFKCKASSLSEVKPCETRSLSHCNIYKGLKGNFREISKNNVFDKWIFFVKTINNQKSHFFTGHKQVFHFTLLWIISWLTYEATLLWCRCEASLT